MKLEKPIFRYITIFLNISSSLISAKVNNKCSMNNIICLSEKNCNKIGGVTINEQCPNDSSTIKCCVEKTCYARGLEGICMHASKCNGISYSKACSGNYQCCILNDIIRKNNGSLNKRNFIKRSKKKNNKSKKFKKSKKSKSNSFVTTSKKNKIKDKESKTSEMIKYKTEKEHIIYQTIIKTVYGCPKINNNNTTVSGNTKIHEALSEILSDQVECQNEIGDSSNYFDNDIGYTCSGITPGIGYHNRHEYFAYALEKCEYKKAYFVKCAYDLDKNSFIDAAEKLYNDQYATIGGCVNLPQPAYYVCLDIALHQGPLYSSEIIKNNPIGNMNGKEYGLLINEISGNKYIELSENSNFMSYIDEWINIIEKREEYCKNYCT